MAMPDMYRADVQVLTEETVKLLRMNVADLYATLGGQLLGAEAPSKVAGIMSYLAAARSARTRRRSIVLYLQLHSMIGARAWQ
jgi:hypothetical protein